MKRKTHSHVEDKKQIAPTNPNAEHIVLDQLYEENKMKAASSLGCNGNSNGKLFGTSMVVQQLHKFVNYCSTSLPHLYTTLFSNAYLQGSSPTPLVQPVSTTRFCDKSPNLVYSTLLQPWLNNISTTLFPHTSLKHSSLRHFSTTLFSPTLLYVATLFSDTSSRRSALALVYNTIRRGCPELATSAQFLPVFRSFKMSPSHCCAWVCREKCRTSMLPVLQSVGSKCWGRVLSACLCLTKPGPSHETYLARSRQNAKHFDSPVNTFWMHATQESRQETAI